MLIRNIFAEHSDFYRNLFSDGVIAKLYANNLLIESHIVCDAGDNRLLIEHPAIEPLSYPPEWSPTMLKDAALKTINLVIELLNHNLTLQDATPYNIVFDGTNPVFVDITSISQVEAALLWKPYDQFMRLFFFPLLLYSLNSYNFARFSLFNYYGGIGYPDTQRLLPMRFRIKNFLSLDVPYYIERFYPEIKTISLSKYINNDMRRRFFVKLRKKIEKIRIRPSNTVWTRYYDMVDVSEKYRVVERILGDIKPRKVADIGANTGQLSFLAGRMGARVVAMDSNWECVDAIYVTAKEKRIEILPLCIDILMPTPAFGWNLCQYESSFDRLKADFVIMAAIMHHLVLKQWQSFERVVEFAHKITGRYLLIEFVDGTDEMCRKIADTIPSFYTKEIFLENLSKRFLVISEHPLTPTRSLILCEKL